MLHRSGRRFAESRFFLCADAHFTFEIDRVDVHFPFSSTAPTDVESVKVRVARKQRDKMQKFSSCFSTLCKATVEARNHARKLALVTGKLHDAQLKRNTAQSDYDRQEGELSTQEEQRSRVHIETQEARAEALDRLERAKTLVFIVSP